MEKEIIESGLYSADKEGNIFSHWFNKTTKLRLTKKPEGYLKFNASFNKKVKSIYVHRFVWIFFNGEIIHGMNINHLDFNRENNSIKNLELCSHIENVRYSQRANRFINNGKYAIGSKNGRSKLDDEKVIEIFQKLKNGISIKSLMRLYDVGYTAILDIKHKKSWKHLWAVDLVEQKV